MWFKNIQLFQLAKPLMFTPNALATDLEKLAFTPCLATLPMSSGWVSPVDEDYAPLAYGANGYIMICLQVEEKLLPAAVVRQELNEKIKEIESEQQRKIAREEKRSLKDSVYNAMLPKAFSKKSKIYAYFDTKNSWLILDAATEKKTELFLSVLKQTLPNIGVFSPELKRTMPIMTQWLQNDDHPTAMEIGKKCVFQDPNQQTRIIRCQQQDLLANSIQSLMKDGHQVTQIELSWQDQVKFNLNSDFTLRSLKFLDKLLELAGEAAAENEASSFDADFLLMTETLSKVMSDLLGVLQK